MPSETMYKMSSKKVKFLQLKLFFARTFFFQKSDQAFEKFNVQESPTINTIQKHLFVNELLKDTSPSPHCFCIRGEKL